MMTKCSSSSVVILATALSIASGSANAAFVAPASRPSLSTAARASNTKQWSRLSAKKAGDGREEGNLFSRYVNGHPNKSQLEKNVATLCTSFAFSALFLTNPLIPHLPFAQQFSSAHAEDELYAKYGDKGLDTSLVDKDCLVNKCSVQAKACLQDDPECRKGLTCTAKCLGDNACITGCFARYGDKNLDNLLKCTIEDNDCIKIAILDGGADKQGEEPRSIAPTVQRFDMATMEGTWYKVAGYNPNYDCYACQRNTFSGPEGGPNKLKGGLLGKIGADTLQMDVEFSMPRMLPDGSPPPPSGTKEVFTVDNPEGGGLQSVGYNQYSTHEEMVFDNQGFGDKAMDMLTLGKKGEEQLYSRTAHSEGEMFGLKFWENWYIIGQNEPGQDDFKFIYYNGKTRQNTYDGAFVYSRSRNLSPSSMEKVYQIANDAGMKPDQFCKIQNGCFEGDDNVAAPQVEREGLGSTSNPFRGILASTKVSQLLGVESVAAESVIPRTAAAVRPTTTIADDYLAPIGADSGRPWWKEVGDYLEDPRRHFRLMDSMRMDMDWPDYIKARN